MNFDFIRELDGLNRAFDSCSNAEELAISMPDLSMIASRKSAEVLAKFVYLVSHSAEAEELSFADILTNDVVKRYLNNRSLLEALHFIRKNGNVAVHTLEHKSTEESIEVLKNLHYAFGEVAKRMRLITHYPKFDANIEANEMAQFEEIDVNELAKSAYNDYIICCDRVERLKSRFSDMFTKYHLIPGIVDLNEMMEFKTQPLSESIVSHIQEHFSFLAMHAMKLIGDCADQLETEVNHNVELTIYGKNGYKTRNPIKFVEGVLYDLPAAEGFKIVSIYHGPSVAPWFNNDVREEFRDTVSKIGKTENFTYSVFEFLYNHGCGGCSKFENGKWLDLSSEYSSDIVDRDFGADWWCWNVDICINFDFDAHPQILQDLQNVVRKHIPSDQLRYCEDAWADGDTQILISSITWTPRTLRPVKNLLDEINEIINPILSECEGWSGDFNWCQVNVPFAVADIVWTSDGFAIKGLEL